MPPLTIAVVAEKRSTFLQDGFSQQDCAALPHEGEADAIVATLEKLGHNIIFIPGIMSLVPHLADGNYKKWDLVFNIAQGFFGSAREAQVPALLEAYQAPFTFSDAGTMALCQNKLTTKAISAGQRNFDTLLDSKQLSFPLFVKLATEGSSKGIDSFSKVNNVTELRTAVNKLESLYPDHQVFVESFLSGREFTVSLIGSGQFSRVIGIREHIWQESTSSDDTTEGVPDTQSFSSWKSKSSQDFQLQIQDFDIESTDDPQIHAACRLALQAWTVLGCRDAGRVDLRFDSFNADSKPFVLEVNPIAGLLPGHSPLPASAQANGTSYDKLLTGIIESVMSRVQAGQKN